MLTCGGASVGGVVTVSLPDPEGATRQKARLSVSLRATAAWMRKGSKTDSVVAASAAVQDQGAAASCAAPSRESWEITS